MPQRRRILHHLVATFAIWFAISPIAFADIIAVSGRSNSNANGPVDSIVYRVDETTGIARRIGNSGVSHLSGLAIHPTSGLLFGIQNDPVNSLGKLHTIDLTTGQATEVGLTNVAISDIAFHSDGTLYGWLEFGSDAAFDDITDQLVTINQTSAEVSLVGTHQFDTNQTGLAFASDDTLYLKTGEIDRTKDRSDWVGTLRTLDRQTGLELSSQTTSAFPISTLTIGQSGLGYTVTNYSGGSALETINLADGTKSTIDFFTDPNDLDELGNPRPLSIRAIVAVTAVPEPSSLVFATLASAIGIFARRKKRATNTRAIQG